MTHINQDISIDEKEIKMDFVRSSGPGGQNVNKVATAVHLRFDVYSSTSLTDDIRKRLIGLAGRKVTDEGVLLIKADRFRTQVQNREDAVNRLVELIRKAAKEPKIRRKTKPSAAAKRRVMETKRHKSNVKRLRRPVNSTDY